MCVHPEEKGEWGSDEILIKSGLCWRFGGARCRVWGVLSLSPHHAEEVPVPELQKPDCQGLYQDPTPHDLGWVEKMFLERWSKGISCEMAELYILRWNIFWEMVRGNISFVIIWGNISCERNISCEMGRGNISCEIVWGNIHQWDGKGGYLLWNGPNIFCEM